MYAFVTLSINTGTQMSSTVILTIPIYFVKMLTKLWPVTVKYTSN